MTANNLSDPDAHAAFAMSAFDQVWKLLLSKSKTLRDEEMMIQAAHASLYHYYYSGTPDHIQRGEWLISRVYAVLERPEPCLYHAERCLAITLPHSSVPLTLAYAYEAMARASALFGRKSAFLSYQTRCLEAAQKISDPSAKSNFMDDYHMLPFKSFSS